MTDLAAVRAAADAVLARLASDPAFAHTTALRVEVGGTVVLDEHLGGPRTGDVFSVTKTVLGALVGVAVGAGLVPDLDRRVGDVLALDPDAPGARHTWRHLLTMTRGCDVDGAWDVDALFDLPGGWVEHAAAAPQLEPPGRSFRYDGLAAHLLAGALQAAVGRPLAELAEERLLGPLGVRGWDWPTDPEGVPFGFGHLRVDAAGLARLGGLLLTGGAPDGTRLLPAPFHAAMTTARTAGGPPEGDAYGYLTWVGDGHVYAGGWAGNHVVAVPASRAVVVVTGDPGFDPGPPPTDRLAPGWRPGHEVVRELLLPVLRDGG